MSSAPAALPAAVAHAAAALQREQQQQWLAALEGRYGQHQHAAAHHQLRQHKRKQQQQQQQQIQQQDGGSGSSGASNNSRNADAAALGSSPGPARAGPLAGPAAAGAATPGPGSPGGTWGSATPLLDPSSLVIGLPLGEGAFSHVYEGMWLRPNAGVPQPPARAASGAPASCSAESRAAAVPPAAAAAEGAAAGPRPSTPGSRRSTPSPMSPGGLTLALRSRAASPADGVPPDAAGATPVVAVASDCAAPPPAPVLPSTPPQGCERVVGLPAPLAVAVKVLKADRQGRCVDCYRLIREAQVLARLSHKNIVGCYGVGRIPESHPRHPRALFIVQQLVQGLTLATRVHMAAAAAAAGHHPQCAAAGARQSAPCDCGHAGAWYSDTQALGWLLDVAEGLEYLHRRHGEKPTIMHRDLKLENIMLNGPDGHALLVDFGLHRELDARTPRASMRRSHSEALLTSPLGGRAGQWGSAPLASPLVALMGRGDAGHSFGAVPTPMRAAASEQLHQQQHHTQQQQFSRQQQQQGSHPQQRNGTLAAEDAAASIRAAHSLITSPPAASAASGFQAAPALRPALKRCLSSQMARSPQDTARVAALRAAAATGGGFLLLTRSEQQLSQRCKKGEVDGTDGANGSGVCASSGTASGGSSDSGLIPAAWAAPACGGGSPGGPRATARRSSSLRVMWKDLQEGPEDPVAAVVRAAGEGMPARPLPPLQQQHSAPAASPLKPPAGGSRPLPAPADAPVAGGVRPSPFSALARVPGVWPSSEGDGGASCPGCIDEEGDALRALPSRPTDGSLSPVKPACRLPRQRSIDLVLGALRVIGTAAVATGGAAAGCLLKPGVSAGALGDEDVSGSSGSETVAAGGLVHGASDSSSGSSVGGSTAVPRARASSTAGAAVDSADSCATTFPSSPHCGTAASGASAAAVRSPTRAAALRAALARQPSLDRFAAGLRSLGARVVAGIGGRGRSLSAPPPPANDAHAPRDCESSSGGGSGGDDSASVALTPCADAKTRALSPGLPVAPALDPQESASGRGFIMTPLPDAAPPAVLDQTPPPSARAVGLQGRDVPAALPPLPPQQQQGRPEQQQQGSSMAEGHLRDNQVTPPPQLPMFPPGIGPHSAAAQPSAHQGAPPVTPPVPLSQRRSVLVSPLVGAGASLSFTHGAAPWGGWPANAAAAAHLAHSPLLPAGHLPPGTPPTPWAQQRVQYAAVASLLLQQQQQQMAPHQLPTAMTPGRALQHYGSVASVLAQQVAPRGAAAAAGTAGRPPLGWSAAGPPAHAGLVAISAPTLSADPAAPAAACTCGSETPGAGDAAGCSPGGRAAGVAAAASSAPGRRQPQRRCSVCVAQEVRYHLTEAVGSWCYMAPEVLLGHAYNERADTFSFAVVMFEVFSRRLLLSEHTAAAPTPADARRVARAWAERVAMGHRPNLPRCWPEPLRDLIADCWSQDASGRPPLSEVVARLRTLRESPANDPLAAAMA